MEILKWSFKTKQELSISRNSNPKKIVMKLLISSNKTFTFIDLPIYELAYC